MTDLQHIKEVRMVTVTTYDMNRDTAVNDLLARGWVLVSAATSPGDSESASATTYVLGRTTFGTVAA
mgnify:CR=1 FL=1